LALSLAKTCSLARDLSNALSPSSLAAFNQKL
jgi:hypothetical protein